MEGIKKACHLKNPAPDDLLHPEAGVLNVQVVAQDPRHHGGQVGAPVGPGHNLYH